MARCFVLDLRSGKIKRMIPSTEIERVRDSNFKVDSLEPKVIFSSLSRATTFVTVRGEKKSVQPGNLASTMATEPFVPIHIISILRRKTLRALAT